MPLAQPLPWRPKNILGCKVFTVDGKCSWASPEPRASDVWRAVTGWMKATTTYMEGAAATCMFAHYCRIHGFLLFSIENGTVSHERK